MYAIRQDKLDLKESIEISGHLAKFWLTRFRGYRVASARRMPRAGFSGAIRYHNVWRLTKT